MNKFFELFKKVKIQKFSKAETATLELVNKLLLLKNTDIHDKSSNTGSVFLLSNSAKGMYVNFNDNQKLLRIYNECTIRDINLSITMTYSIRKNIKAEKSKRFDEIMSVLEISGEKHLFSLQNLLAE